MKSFYRICVLSTLLAVGTTQPTHNSPHYQMSQHQHYISQPEHHMSQPEHHISQQHGHDSWSDAEVQVQAQSQADWISAEQHYQPVEVLSQPAHHISQPQPHIIHLQPHIMNSQPPLSQPQSTDPQFELSQPQPHIIHPQPYIIHSQPPMSQSQPTDPQLESSEPQPHIIHPQPYIVHSQPPMSQPQSIDSQFELNPYSYQHPNYPSTIRHHTQNTESQYPTHGWNPQNQAVVYQQPLPEAQAPEHYLNPYKNDYHIQSSPASASHGFKVISIPKDDNGADYILPVANHETRGPRIIYHKTIDKSVPDIVQQIIAKYRHIPMEINTEPRTGVNASPPKEQKHKKQSKLPTIPVGITETAIIETVALANTDTDKTFTLKNNDKHRTDTTAPVKQKHKPSHKVLKTLLDPELLAKEFEFLSKNIWIPSPDKSNKKNVPCNDNPIVTDEHENPDVFDGDDELNSPDENKPKDNSHLPADTATVIEMSKTTITTPSTYIEPNNKEDLKHGETGQVFGLVNPQKTTPSNTDKTPEKDAITNKDLPKPIIDDKQKPDSKPVKAEEENNDSIKLKEVVQEKEDKKEETRIVETKKEEKIDLTKKTVQEPTQYDDKPKPINKDDNASEKDDKTNKNLPKPKIDDKQKPDLKPIETKIENNDHTKIKVVQKKDDIKEETKKVEAKQEEKIELTKKNLPEPTQYDEESKLVKQEDKNSNIDVSKESYKTNAPYDKTPSPEFKKEVKEPLPKTNKDKPVPGKTSYKNPDTDYCDLADSETDPKLDETKPDADESDAKKPKSAEKDDKKLNISKNPADEKEVLTSDKVAEILEKADTDEPLSTVGFLVNLFSHALQGTDSVRQMFEEPKVKTFVKGIIPMFHENQKVGPDNA